MMTIDLSKRYLPTVLLSGQMLLLTSSLPSVTISAIRAHPPKLLIIAGASWRGQMAVFFMPVSGRLS